MDGKGHASPGSWGSEEGVLSEGEEGADGQQGPGAVAPPPAALSQPQIILLQRPPPDPQLPPLASPCFGILRSYTTTHPERSPVLPRLGGLEPQRLPGVGSWCLSHQPVGF